MKIAKEQIKGIETLATKEYVNSAISSAGSGGSGGTVSAPETYSVDFFANRWDQEIIDYYVGGGTDYELLFLDLDYFLVHLFFLQVFILLARKATTKKMMKVFTF